MQKILFYDCEIANCIPGNYFKEDGYTYCKGWEDFKGMGISCIATYASWKGYNIYLNHQLDELQDLINEADEIVGFNSIAFDDKLLEANGVNCKTTYDLLCETRIAAGMPPHYVPRVTRKGYALQDVSMANLDFGKSGHGALAPLLWQDGKFKQVIDYCLNDIELLIELYERRSHLVDPVNGSILLLRGGSKWKNRLYRLKRWLRVKTTKSQSYNPLAAFWWAVVHSDITDCQIKIRPPITFYLDKYNQSIHLRLNLPKIYVAVPYDIRQKYLEDSTGGIDPF